MTDAFAVAWKEWRELMGQGGLRGKLGMALFIVVFGIVLPLQSGPRWVMSPAAALAWAWAPMFLVTTVVADAFAGERERHTLETLLASRLADGAILAGKMGAAIGYAAAVTLACLVLGVVTVTVAFGRGSLLVYTPRAAAAMLVLGLLGALFVAALGVLASLRAATVRQAQQALSGAVVIVLVAPLVVVRMLPREWMAPLLASPPRMAALGLLGVAALAVLDIGLVALAAFRFRRARLIAP